MKKLITTCIGLAVLVPLAFAEPPEGKGNNKDQTPDLGPVQVYAQGTPIGRYLGAVLADGDRQSVQSAAVWLLSDMGYVFTVDLAPPYRFLHQSNEIYFSEPHCEGKVWANAQGLSWTAGVGTVVAAPDGWPVYAYYSLRGQGPVQGVVWSNFSDTGNIGCNSDSEPHMSEVYELFPNDPAITGVPDLAPAGPYVLGPPE